MEIEIRQLTLDDLDPVMEIEPVAFGDHHWSRQAFINEINNVAGQYFAAICPDSHELCGYSGFWLIGEEAHITTLAVHPEYRRRSVGERLLIHQIKEARKLGARWITLEVRVTNEWAQNLYFKYGFKNLGVRRSYYQDNGEDALVLWTENIENDSYQKLIEQREQELNNKDKGELTCH